MDSDRGDQHAITPIRVHAVLDVEYVSPQRLPHDVAAQIVRNHGETTIQVNDTVPSAQWRAVAQHCRAEHDRGCYTRTCPFARAVLRAVTLSATAATA